MGKKKQGRGRAKSRNRRTVLTKIVVDTPKGSGVFPTFADAFLPIDYPNSVESGYLPYQIWDLIQGLTSYFRGNLAMKETLKALGVGDVAANATSSALSKLILQGTSMFGGLVFTWMASDHFGRHTRQWRLFADVINDIGLTLQMIAPLCGKEYFLQVSILSTVALSMCGISAGATKASISNFFAKSDNLTDLVAKEGSQETAVNILGIIGGYYFLAILNDNIYVTWMAFTILTALHVFANMQAVQELKFRTINNCRLGLLYKYFRNGNYNQMTPDNIATDEPYLFYWSTLPTNVNVGTTINPTHFADVEEYEHLLRMSAELSAKQNCHYLLLPREINSKDGVNILLDNEAQQIDILKAYFAGLQCQEFSDLDEDAFNQIYKEKKFHQFLTILERNHFDTTKIKLSTRGKARYAWRNIG